MPTYQYECSACNHEFEVFQSMLDDPIKKCPQCHKLKLHRLIGTGTGIIFKGKGFYETDYKKKKSSTDDSPSSASKPAPTPAAKSHGCSPHCGCAA